MVTREHYLLQLGRYIVLNPVRAKMVKHRGRYLLLALPPCRIHRHPKGEFQ